MKRITVLLLYCLALVGCTEYKISKVLKEFSEQTIILPSDLVRIVDGTVSVSGHPVFVGNPISGARLWELFERTLKKLMNEKAFRGL